MLCNINTSAKQTAAQTAIIIRLLRNSHQKPSSEVLSPSLKDFVIFSPVTNLHGSQKAKIFTLIAHSTKANKIEMTAPAMPILTKNKARSL